MAIPDLEVPRAHFTGTMLLVRGTGFLFLKIRILAKKVRQKGLFLSKMRPFSCPYCVVQPDPEASA